MTRKIAGVAGIASAATVVATLGLAATAVPGTAASAPSPLPAAKGAPRTKPDNLPDPLSAQHNQQRRDAVNALVAGDAKTIGKGPNRVIQTPDGAKVDYPTTQSAELLTFLVDFGSGGNPAFADNTAGPVHGQIPAPAADDNSTYWLPNFSRQHYMDMFFNGLQDQGGESFKDFYKEESSGRFDLEGDVSDWVTLPHAESYYQSATDDDNDPSTPPAGDEDGTSMKNYIQDTGNAWYHVQKAGGKSDAQIKQYLSTFDQWDRFDYDHDGNYNEPDGYIDHFQAIHAGMGEEAGAPAWTIWSHRWAANPSGDVGPTVNGAPDHAGGVEIGNTGFWIRDYTTEPENGGLGVFSHEFGHDLGLDDYYDTNGGDNGTGFWTLMSRGSWQGHGGDTPIGTTPDHIGAPDKLFLGWYGNNDLAVVDGTGDPQDVTLGPSYHATTTGAQAVAVTLPQGSATTTVVAPDQGTHYFYSGAADGQDATLTSPDVQVPAGGGAADSLTARVSYDLEKDYDYAYLEASADGGATWTHVHTDKSTATNPNQANEGEGITNCSGTGTGAGNCVPSWTTLTADLSAFAGQTVKLRFETVTDEATHGLGLSVDNIKLGSTVLTNVEDGAPNWALNGWRVMNGSTYTTVYDQYYLAENRQPMGYDKTLAEGPYSFDYSLSHPDEVDHFPYQDGLLVWYVNGLYADNNTSTHPGGGEALPVDANPKYVLWTQNGAPAYYASGDLNSRDATFDVDQTDALHLTSENSGGPINFDVDAKPGVPVFDDTNPTAYWDNTYPSRSSWYSTKVAGAGSMIQVLSSDETNGRMVIKAGRHFVAATAGTAAITGTPAVGQTLTGVAPTFWGTGVATSYKWYVDGKFAWGTSTYTVKPEDAGKKIDLVVTAAKGDYLPWTQTVSVTVAQLGAPAASSAPAVAGTPVVGQRLTATPGAWSMDGASAFSWAVGGKQVGTGASYVVQPADVGKSVTVTETRTVPGHQPGTSTSTPTGAVAAATTSISVDAPKKVRKGHRSKITVTVSASGVTPTGPVEVKYAGKTLTGQLVNGAVRIHLPRVTTTGQRKVVVSYGPATGFTASRTSVRIHVTH